MERAVKWAGYWGLGMVVMGGVHAVEVNAWWIGAQSHPADSLWSAPGEAHLLWRLMADGRSNVLVTTVWHFQGEKERGLESRSALRR